MLHRDASEDTEVGTIISSILLIFPKFYVLQLHHFANILRTSTVTIVDQLR